MIQKVHFQFWLGLEDISDDLVFKLVIYTLFLLKNCQMLTHDHPNGFTYLQLGRDFINLFLFKYLVF